MFSVKLLRKSETQTPQKMWEYQESIVIIHADSNEEAELFAELYYTIAEVESTNEHEVGSKTTWEFVDILDSFEIVEELTEVPNFTEVYRRFFLVDGYLTDKEVVDNYFSAT